MQLYYSDPTCKKSRKGTALGGMTPAAAALICDDSDKKRTSDYWIEKICPICGKRFYPPTDEWAYRRGDEYFCSWHCLCEHDRRQEARLRAVGVPKGRLPEARKTERNASVRRDNKRGISVIELARRHSLSRTQIYRIIGTHGVAGNRI